MTNLPFPKQQFMSFMKVFCIKSDDILDRARFYNFKIKKNHADLAQFFLNYNKILPSVFKRTL
ncbi:hypothetical protein KGI01_00920 [Kurthia gibsonii]|nr:hypothetical protein KGI01_00920 [Kurthia gibsonii]